MSSPVIDTVIIILLVTSVGFGGIGVIGLILFPDIRSRIYTAFRATLISISAMILSVLLYALSAIQLNGGGQYTTLVIHSLVLLVLAVVANVVFYNMILNRTKNGKYYRVVSGQNQEK